MTGLSSAGRPFTSGSESAVAMRLSISSLSSWPSRKTSRESRLSSSVLCDLPIASLWASIFAAASLSASFFGSIDESVSYLLSFSLVSSGSRPSNALSATPFLRFVSRSDWRADFRPVTSSSEKPSAAVTSSVHLVASPSPLCVYSAWNAESNPSNSSFFAITAASAIPAPSYRGPRPARPPLTSSPASGQISGPVFGRTPSPWPGFWNGRRPSSALPTASYKSCTRSRRTS